MMCYFVLFYFTSLVKIILSTFVFIVKIISFACVANINEFFLHPSQIAEKLVLTLTQLQIKVYWEHGVTDVTLSRTGFLQSVDLKCRNEKGSKTGGLISCIFMLFPVLCFCKARFVIVNHFCAMQITPSNKYFIFSTFC